MLEDFSNRYKGSSFKQENEKGLKIYRLKIAYGDSEIVYKVYPQNLGSPLQGVSLKTRPDFVMNCVRLSENGKEWSLNEIETLKSIAIYLDGYEYHASENHPRFPSDLAIRNNIIESGRYNQWIFTWGDFSENMFNEKDVIGLKQDEKVINDKFFLKHPSFKGYNVADIFLSNNITRFFHLIINPITNIDLKNWSSLTLFNSQSKMMGAFYSAVDIEAILSQRSISEIEQTSPGLDNYVYADGVNLRDEAAFGIFIRPKDFEVKAYGVFKIVPFWEKENWINFWKIYNLTQFHSVKVESSDVEVKSKEIELDSEVSNEVLSNFDERLHDIVKLLFKNNIEFNTEYDFDLVENDEIIASAELGSHTKKIVVNPFDEESKQTFIKNGYKVFNPDNFKLEELI